MKSFRNVGLILLMALAGGVLAQRAPQLIISPRVAEVQPGQGQRFEAAAFNANGQPLRLASVNWQVLPDTLGRITDDGFFMAGRSVGRGKIVAIAKVNNLPEPLKGEAEVIVGRPDQNRIVAVIEPANAVIPPGQTETFRVRLQHPPDIEVRINAVRWHVRPPELGKIEENGRFTAGPNFGAGVIVAFVETDKGLFNGEAKVTVGQRPSAAIKGHVAPVNEDMRLFGVVTADRLGDNSRWHAEARIDADGNYLLGKLLPGLYVVRAQARGYLPEFYKDARHYALATPLQVGAQDTLTDIDFSLDLGGTIAGTISSDDDNAAIAGAHVFAVHVITNEKRHAVTNADGNFTIEGLASGNNAYAVFAEAEGYKGEFYDDADNLLNAKLLTVIEGQSVEGINMSLALGSAISGRVVDAVSGDPIAQAAVLIYSPLASQVRPVHVVHTNDAGEYVAGARPGEYYVAVEARGYHKEYYDDSRDLRNATKVPVLQDQHTTGIDFKLDPLNKISGRVVDETTKAPIEGAVVIAFPEPRDRNSPRDPAHGKSPFIGRTDARGNYQIMNVPGGKYFVLAEARGYLPEFWQEAPDLAHAQPVEVPESGDVTGIDFTLVTGGAISGTVVSASDGAPLGGAQVLVWSRTSNAAEQTQTGRDGKYRVGGLRTGEYLVYVEAKDFKPQFFDGAETRNQATSVKVESSHETSGIDFKLEKLDDRRGAITGTVVSEIDGNPIPNAFVLAMPIQNGPPVLGFTDRLGGYEIKGILPGKYVVLAAAPHFVAEFYDNARSWREANRVEVGAGRPASGIDFKLTPAPRGAYNIAGTVMRSDARHGESNAVIYAIENGVYVGSAVPDDGGNYVMSALPVGDYKIMASGADGDGYYRGTDLNNAATVSVGNGVHANSINVMLNGVTKVEEAVVPPTQFALEQNYPNPFNPETMIPYQLAARGKVSLIIYNALGQEVRTLIATTQEAGAYEMRWDGKDNRGSQLPTGVYLYRLKAGEVTFTRKMIYLR